MADPSDFDTTAFYRARNAPAPRRPIRGRLSLFSDSSKYYPGTFFLRPSTPPGALQLNGETLQLDGQDLILGSAS